LKQHQYRASKRFSLVFLDIDDFGVFNKRFSDDVGDKVIKAFAKRLRTNVHASDFICRKGGDEFLLGFIGLDAKGAETRALKIRESLARQPLVLDEEEDLKLPISISFGISSITGDQISDSQAAFDKLKAEADAGKRKDKEGKEARRPGWFLEQAEE
jgi:diguanylate cyclase (GGDEF)-like protein